MVKLEKKDKDITQMPPHSPLPLHISPPSLLPGPPPSPPQVGDGTTSVVLLAGAILKNCKPFVEDNVHPQVIVRGLRKATQLSLQKIRDIAVQVKIDDPK